MTEHKNSPPRPYPRYIPTTSVLQYQKIKVNVFVFFGGGGWVLNYDLQVVPSVVRQSLFCSIFVEPFT